jgi:hypothetical protein
MGIKRKLEDPEVTTTVVQRQSILDISMFKLQSNPVKRVEPSPPLTCLYHAEQHHGL